MGYISAINYAVIFFPFAALLFTMPFILNQYHKYGSISFLKSIITYLFIFYLICAYFLVILPLPTIEEVAKLSTPQIQPIPFEFMIDFINHTSFDITNYHTYIKAMKESYFYVPMFNILLTIPFGFFLKYYFKCGMKTTIIYTFLLSLFFELTQLTGLYFIYPRGYRLCDIDDLILNTLGGLIGFIISKPLINILPKIDYINANATEKGKIISGPRRTLAFLLDLFILFIIEIITIIIFEYNTYLTIIIALLYYFIIPLFLNTSTPGKKYLNIAVLDYNGTKNIPRLLLRKFLVILIYIIIPISIFKIIININNGITEFLGLIILGNLFILYSITTIKYIFTGKDIIYEKLSKTKLVSTIK